MHILVAIINVNISKCFELTSLGSFQQSIYDFKVIFLLTSTMTRFFHGVQYVT